jgi:hypothetical protein
MFYFILRHKEQSGMISVLNIWNIQADGGSAPLPIRNFFLFCHILDVKAFYELYSKNLLRPLLLIYYISRDITFFLRRSFGQ